MSPPLARSICMLGYSNDEGGGAVRSVSTLANGFAARQRGRLESGRGHHVDTPTRRNTSAADLDMLIRLPVANVYAG